MGHVALGKEFLRTLKHLRELVEQREAVHDIAFRRYHCNQWVAAEAPWISGEAWDACKAEPELNHSLDTIIGVAIAVLAYQLAVNLPRRLGRDDRSPST